MLALIFAAAGFDTQVVHICEPTWRGVWCQTRKHKCDARRAGWWLCPLAYGGFAPFILYSLIYPVMAVLFKAVTN